MKNQKNGPYSRVVMLSMDKGEVFSSTHKRGKVLWGRGYLHYLLGFALLLAKKFQGLEKGYDTTPWYKDCAQLY